MTLIFKIDSIFATLSLLSPEIILNAYMGGAFPMAHPEEDNAIYWHTPHLRGIIPLDEGFYINKNLRKLYNAKIFSITVNQNFEEVIHECAYRRSESWISEEIIEAYIELHRMGFAHSIEVWHNNEIAGGLYGVAIGKAFFGESMFTIKSNASKISLIYLVELLRKNEFKLLDTQYLNDHIAQFGAYEISREEYMKRLAKALEFNTEIPELFKTN